jgi:hypothetical protein
MKYRSEAKNLWKTAVPPKGQAATVQGELLRAVEKLRDEARRNGNMNWDHGHEILVYFLRRTLVPSGVFSGLLRTRLERDLERIGDPSKPITDDEIFDRLADCVIEWCLAHPAPVPHTYNPDLQR